MRLLIIFLMVGIPCFSIKGQTNSVSNILKLWYDRPAKIWKNNLQGPYSARCLTMANLYLNLNLNDTHTTNYHRKLELNSAVGLRLV